MKITLLLVGKTTDSRLISLIEDYRKRLLHYVPFEMVVLPDLKNTKSMSEEQIKTAEGEVILEEAFQAFLQCGHVQCHQQALLIYLNLNDT